MPRIGRFGPSPLPANPHVLLLTGCHRWDEGLEVRPATVLAFAKGRFSQTRYRLP